MTVVIVSLTLESFTLQQPYPTFGQQVFVTPSLSNTNEILIRTGIFKKAAIVSEMDYKDKYTMCIYNEFHRLLFKLMQLEIICDGLLIYAVTNNDNNKIFCTDLFWKYHAKRPFCIIPTVS